jgi:adenine-specific DNA-methyltransferase
MPKRDYDQWDKKALIAHIQKLEKRKKYGLVWDEESTKEIFELRAQNALPILDEVPDNRITTSPDQPTYILIEGDNFHALSVLSYTHENSVDVIYIDPPYNKGVKGTVDFRYNDKFIDSEDAFRHSKWLSFISKRLVLARNLLKKTGVIFISIDEVEFAQLKLLCDEIFYEPNLVGTFVWKARSGKGGTADKIATIHEYILCYAKDIQYTKIKPDIRIGSRKREQLRQWGNQGDTKEARETMFFEIPAPDGTMVTPIREDGTEGRWRVGKKKAFELLANGELEFEQDENGRWKVYRTFANDKITETAIDSLLLNLGTASNGTKELQKFFGDKTFDTAKPVPLIKYLIEIGAYKIDSPVVLDFFGGSGTTAQAVMELNSEDGADRKCILVTNNENNIMTEVCYPRIKKVIEGYKYTGNDKRLLFEEKFTLSRLKKIEKILAEYEETREVHENEFNELKSEFKDSTLRLWGINYIDEFKEGLGGNLKYYTTSFVSAEPSDENKELLTHRSVDMLCLREATFDSVDENDTWKIFRNSQRYTAILFDQLCIPELKDELEKFDKPTSVYIFSLEDDNFADEFADISGKVKVCSIPEAILRVYRRIYQ